MKIFRPSAFLLMALLLTGCQTRSFPGYVTSRDSLFYLQQIDAEPVSVAAFTGDPRTGLAARPEGLAACPLETDEQTGALPSYEQYVRQALVEELSAAGLYTEAADATRISGQIDYLRFGRRLPFSGVWSISLTLVSSNGSVIRAENEYRFDAGALYGPAICRRAFEALEPAVRQLMEKAIISPHFGALLD